VVATFPRVNGWGLLALTITACRPSHRRLLQGPHHGQVDVPTEWVSPGSMTRDHW
jgi:hypothetical protein